jgi:hypothetical protein
MYFTRDYKVSCARTGGSVGCGVRSKPPTRTVVVPAATRRSRSQRLRASRTPVRVRRTCAKRRCTYDRGGRGRRREPPPQRARNLVRWFGREYHFLVVAVGTKTRRPGAAAARPTRQVAMCGLRIPHDWAACPFAHQGERAARRDPARCPYRSVPCEYAKEVRVRHRGVEKAVRARGERRAAARTRVAATGRAHRLVAVRSEQARPPPTMRRSCPQKLPCPIGEACPKAHRCALVRGRGDGCTRVVAWIGGWQQRMHGARAFLGLLQHRPRPRPPLSMPVCTNTGCILTGGRR